MNSNQSKIVVCLSILIALTAISFGKNDKNNNSGNQQQGQQPQRPQPPPPRPQPPRPLPPRPLPQPPRQQPRPQRPPPPRPQAPKQGPAQPKPKDQKPKSEGQQPKPAPKPSQGGGGSGSGDSQAKSKNGPDSDAGRNRGSKKGSTPSNAQTLKDGTTRTTKTTQDGKKSEQVDERPDGSRHNTIFNSKGKETGSVEIAKDGSKTSTSLRRDRDGETHSTEVIKHNANGKPVSKTVTVGQPSALAQKTAFKGKSFVKNYQRGRYGFVYRHGPARLAYVKLFRGNAVVIRPYRYAWHWNPRWYGSDMFYFPVYSIYTAPDYWVTDWMVASYLSDAYWTEPDITEGGPDTTIINDELKEDLRVQVVNTINEEETTTAEAEETTADVDSGKENSEPDKPIASDLVSALKNPKYIYPVSETLSVTLDADDTHGVTVSCGDLLRLEEGQGDFADATENELVKMHVMSSKGQQGEAKAGDIIKVPLKSLQDFDSEFHSRVDQGLTEAVANKELFDAGAE